MIRWISVVCALFVQASFPQAPSKSNEPKFTDYTVPVATEVSYVSPKLTTPGQRRFRTVIRRSVGKGPNFAGHYTIAEWGCGTGCVQFVVVDNESGAVHDAPFGNLPKAYFCLGANPDRDETGIFYRPDSSLLVLRGCPNDKDCRAIYYLWTGSQFKVLFRSPMRPVFGCEP
jgi:hypothetical protein